jgi:hypothetical protein
MFLLQILWKCFFFRYFGNVSSYRVFKPWWLARCTGREKGTYRGGERYVQIEGGGAEGGGSHSTYQLTLGSQTVLTDKHIENI